MAKTSTKEKTKAKKPATTTKVAKKPVAKAATRVAPKATSKDSNLFAVFTTGGKQYRVQVGDKVKIEIIKKPSVHLEHKEGDKITFTNVLLKDDGRSDVTVGTPFIAGAKVEATLNKIARYKTIDVIKYKSKSRYFKKYGHRQPYFEVVIDSIK